MCSRYLVTKGRAQEVGVATDLSKFYPSLKLREEDWNLQFLWMIPSLKIGDEPKLYVVTSLIFGVASVAAQSEAAMTKIAERYPDLKEVLEARYVDDLATSVKKVKQAEDIRDRTTKVLTAYQLIPKGWSISGQTPDQKIAPDGLMIIAGLIWSVMEDTFTIKIPSVYFAKKVKGNMQGIVTFNCETLGELQ